MMNLKGYNFYNLDDKLQATFILKDLTLMLYEEIDEVRLIEIKNHLEDDGFKIHNIIKCY